MRLPRRRTLWLSAALVLAVVVGGVCFLAGRSRITQANFNKIQSEMNIEEVTAILGECTPETGMDPDESRCEWRNGPNWTEIYFREGVVYHKFRHFATTWETLIWYAKKGAEKIGVRWD